MLIFGLAAHLLIPKCLFTYLVIVVIILHNPSLDPDLDVIPPLMLTKLIEADKDQSGKIENDGSSIDVYCCFYFSFVFKLELSIFVLLPRQCLVFGEWL